MRFRTTDGFTRIATLALFLSSGSASALIAGGLHLPHLQPAHVTEETQADEELTQLVGVMRHDLTAFRARERERLPFEAPSRAQQQSASIQRNGLTSLSTAPTSLASITNVGGGGSVSYLRMPVSGVTTSDIENSWGDPRDGGARKHRGIDIFAPRGTAVVASADGYISYIGTQPKGGQCLWLTTNDSLSLYYAHLDRWAPGMYEGMEVHAGDLLGYVGNTGNALHTPSHLHFSILDNDEAVNPYMVLKYGRNSGKVVLHGGIAAGGTR